MHVISQKRINEAKQQYPDCETALDGWLRIVKKNDFQNFAELKEAFNSVDKVGDFYVFNIGGNKLRLIASIHFNTEKLYIRYVLDHSEYDKDKWKS